MTLNAQDTLILKKSPSIELNSTFYPVYWPFFNESLVYHAIARDQKWCLYPLVGVNYVHSDFIGDSSIHIFNNGFGIVAGATSRVKLSQHLHFDVTGELDLDYLIRKMYLNNQSHGKPGIYIVPLLSVLGGLGYENNRWDFKLSGGLVTEGGLNFLSRLSIGYYLN